MDREEIIKSWYKDWLENIQSVHSIFVHTYGEDRVDLQHVTEEEFAEDVLGNFNKVSEEMWYQEQIVKDMRTQFFASEKAIILVLWPEAIIKNERDQSHLIREFYAKIVVNGHGKLAGNLSFSRAHYNLREWSNDYAHSHLPGIPSKDISTWAEPCFGRGPINSTIAGLTTSNDWELWMLLTVQLDQFVHVESIEGVPYKHLGSLSGRQEAVREYKFNFYHYPLNILLAGNPTVNLDTIGFTKGDLQNFAKEFCLKFRQLGLFIRYDSGFYNWGSSFVNTVTTMSDLFIDWFNNKKLNGEINIPYESLIALGILKRSVLDGNSLETVTTGPITLREQDYVPYIGRQLGFFKGKPISIKIDSGGFPHRVAPNTLLILNTGIVLAILTSLLKTINIYYGFKGNLTAS